MNKFQKVTAFMTAMGLLSTITWFALGGYVTGNAGYFNWAQQYSPYQYNEHGATGYSFSAPTFSWASLSSALYSSSAQLRSEGSGRTRKK